MINQLPRWVEIGGFVLALIAGCVNAIALLSFNHQGVSHLTGSSSLLSVELAQGNFAAVLHLLAILLSFVLGAAVSGFVVGNQYLQLGQRYSAALFAESLALILAMYFLNQESNIGHYFASAACGLQNAMTSTFSGAIVRTTHMTGLFTDLGISLGSWLRGKKTDRRRLILYSLLIVGFVVGGIVGAVLFVDFGFYTLLLPAMVALGVAVAYLVYLKFVLAKRSQNQERP